MSMGQAKLIGVRAAVEALLELRPALVRKTMRIAMNAAGGIVKREAVARVTKESGLLKSSLSVKVKAAKNGEWFAATGPRRGMKRAYRINKRGTAKLLSAKKQAKAFEGGAKLTYRNPTRYAHLVENGTAGHQVTTSKRSLASNGTYFGKSVRISARAKPFLRPAADAAAEPAAGAAIRKIQEGITTESARLYAIQTAKAGV